MATVEITDKTKNAIAQKTAGGNPMEWLGLSLHSWESVFWSATIVAAIAGGISVASAGIAGVVGFKVADILFKDADRRIAEATERQARAEAETAKANLELEKLRTEAAQAHERAEAAKAEAAKANERILKMQRLRRLTKEQAEALTPLLKSDLFQQPPRPSPLQAVLRIGAVADAEAQMYAMDFQRLFESCGVNIYPTNHGSLNEVTQLEPNADGLILVVKSINNPVQAHSQFQRLMHALGMPLRVEEDAKHRENEAMLVVLRKPD